MNDRHLVFFLTGGAGIGLPLGQAVITGALVGLLAFSVALLARLERPWAYGLAFGLLAMLASWLTYVGQWRGVIFERGEPEIAADAELLPEPVRVEIIENGGQSATFARLPAGRDQLVQLAQGLMQGQSLSEAAWTGAGRPFTRAEFAALRAELLRRGLAAWNNPRCPARGAALTSKGRAVMRYLASADLSPALLEGEDLD